MIFPSTVTKTYPEFFAQTEDGTFRFIKGAQDEAVAAKKDRDLAKAWTRAKRYEGKGCLNAVDNAEGVLARLFVGKKVADLKSIAAIDRVLLNAELKATQDMGLLGSGAPDRAARIAVMQRKGTLGMNAVLSLSLALARMSAAIEGKELWSGIRAQMQETMAKTIAANGGVKLMPPDLAQKLGSTEGREVWQALEKNLNLDELVQGLQALARSKPEEVKLHELLRQQLPVYDAEV
jgi:hypothetical protein